MNSKHIERLVVLNFGVTTSTWIPLGYHSKRCDYWLLIWQQQAESLLWFRQGKFTGEKESCREYRYELWLCDWSSRELVKGICFYDPENKFILQNIIKIHTFG